MNVQQHGLKQQSRSKKNGIPPANKEIKWSPKIQERLPVTERNWQALVEHETVPRTSNCTYAVRLNSYPWYSLSKGNINPTKIM